MKKKKKKKEKKGKAKESAKFTFTDWRCSIWIFFIPFAIVIILRIANNWETYTFQYRQVDERGQGP